MSKHKGTIIVLNDKSRGNEGSQAEGSSDEQGAGSDDLTARVREMLTGCADGSPLGISTHKSAKTSENDFSEGEKRGLKIDLFPDGCRIHGDSQPGNPDGKGGRDALRGEISGWSQSSRKRMRDFLLDYEMHSEYRCVAVTLTIPGPVMEGETVKRLWKLFKDRITKAGICAVWRLEQQERGAIHWHLIAGVPPGVEPDAFRSIWSGSLRALGVVKYDEWKPDRGGYYGGSGASPVVDCSGFEWAFRGIVQGTYKHDDGHYRLKLAYMGGDCRVALDRVSAESLSGQDGEFLTLAGRYDLQGGRVVLCDVATIEGLPEGWPDDWTGSAIRKYPDLSMWPGAGEHACDVEEKPDVSGAWKRYMQDHCTKAKQAQVCTLKGFRHWGKIRESAYVQRRPDEKLYFDTEKQRSAFLRAYRRLRTPFVKCDKAPQGRKLGYAPNSCRRGKTVQFTRPETVRRLFEWARLLHPSYGDEAKRVEF